MTAAPSEPVRRLSLKEHATLTVPPPPLDPAAVEALRRCDAVTVTGQGHQTELRSKSLVGVIRAGPVELRITPKLTIRRLLWLLDYARNPKGWHDDDIVGLTEVDPEDTVTAVAVSFVAATRRALAAGLLQGYRTIEQTDRPGIPLPVEIRYDDYTVDIPENQLLLAATLTLLSAPGLPAATTRGLRQLRADLDEVTPQPAAALQHLPLREDHLSRRYSPALRLAHIVLAGHGLDQPAGDVAATGFLFNLDSIFENWLRAVLDNALKRHGTGPLSFQHKMYLDKAGSIEVRPDLVWLHQGRPAAVIDAKYIQFTPAGRTPQYFQMLAYCLVLGLPAGYIVYAAGDRRAIRHEIRDAGITLHVWPLNLDAPTPDILADIDTLAAHIAAHAHPPP